VTAAPLIRPFRQWTPKVDPSAFVAPGATVIGNVEIGAGSGVWFGAVLRGDVNEIRIGRRTNLQDGSVVHVSRAGSGTYIGDEVTIGHMVLLHACRLMDRCFIGMKACIMDDAVVETGAMVAAGAVVTPGKRVPAGELWAGSPAKLKRVLTPDEIARFADSVDVYAKLAEEYRLFVF